MNKVKEWLHRYLPGEILGILFSILFATIVRNFHPAVIGYAGAMGSNVGFYGIIIVKDYSHRFKKEGLSLRSLYKTTRNIIIEFGPAEYFDSFVIRPLVLALFPLFIPNFAFAIFLGNVAANVTFYIPVIMSYELRKKYLD